MKDYGSFKDKMGSKLILARLYMYIVYSIYLPPIKTGCGHYVWETVLEALLKRIASYLFVLLIMP